MNQNNLIALSLCSSLILIGCGGGGGGGGGVIPQSPVPFTSFDAIQPNQAVVASGISQATTWTTSASTGLVTSRTPGNLDKDNTELTLGYDSSTVLDAVTVKAPGTNLSWSKSAGDTFDDTGLIISINNPEMTRIIATVDAMDASLTWNYQTFGIWNTASLSGSVVIRNIGIISAGSASPVSGIPTTGTATYNGFTAGFYSDASGNPYGFASSLSANADFVNRNISFNTTDTLTNDLITTTIVSAPRLDLGGNLSYSATSNQFSGTLTSADTTLTGTATGQFYGPNAQEIGGTFLLEPVGGGSLESMIGGFGAKQ